VTDLHPDAPRIHRFEVPVDARWHRIPVAGRPLHVAARYADTVEFWALHDPNRTPEDRWFRVYGTGQPITADGWLHRGTTLTADGQLVWHLLESAPAGLVPEE
jgi:hypothetical protein